MLTKTVDIKKKPPGLKALLSLVANGTEIVITDNDTPIARMVQIGKRVAGLHAGAILIGENFDEPLPDDFWTGNT